MPYAIVQVVGAIVAGGVLYAIASGSESFDPAGGFAANGYGEHSPGGYTLGSALLIEIVLTGFFLIVILGATDPRSPFAIGLALTLIHLISIPVTNTSVNPARSTGVAVFAGGWALGQVGFVLGGAGRWRPARRRDPSLAAPRGAADQRSPWPHAAAARLVPGPSW